MALARYFKELRVYRAGFEAAYDQVSGGLIKMLTDPQAWCGPAALREGSSEYLVGSPGTPASLPDDSFFVVNMPGE